MTPEDVKLTEAERQLLHDQLESWFGYPRHTFLVSDLAPTVERIIAERIPATFAVAANLRARLAGALADLADAREVNDRSRTRLRAAIAEGARALERLDAYLDLRRRVEAIADDMADARAGVEGMALRKYAGRLHEAVQGEPE